MKGSQGLDALAAASKECAKTEGAMRNETPAITPAANTTNSEAPSASGPAILPKTTQQPNVTRPNVVQQPLQPAMALGGNQVNPAAFAMLQAAALQGAMPVGAPVDPSSMNAIQQLAFLQYMQVASQAAAMQQAQTASNIGNGAQPTPKTPLAFVGPTPQLPTQPEPSKSMAKQQRPQLPQPQQTASSGNSMQPPLPPSQVTSSQTSISTTGIVIPPPLPPRTPVTSKPSQTVSQQSTAETGAQSEDRKQLKRAANRRSAQLSRKRKKQFIEELKEENDELRRKEQILKSIPDLVVVFDSSGKLWFVSHSVSRFLDFSPRELESSSFWDRLCEESVRLLKAAFMDALAARKGDMATTPLGSGMWEIRLVDKDGTSKVVTLNGVVHFSGESPECVCTIRPREEDATPSSLEKAAVALPKHRNVSVSSGDNSSSSSASSFVRHPIMAQQSVISNRSDDSQIAPINAKRSMHQISDGDTGSCISESASDE